MSAMIEKMALIGQPSWHGLEEVVTADTTIDEWKVVAGLDHAVVKTPVMYYTNDLLLPNLQQSADKFVLYRADTGKDLSIVGVDYKVVQPATIIDFFGDLTAQYNFTMETAGSLAGGRKVWALARTGNEFSVGGVDLVKQYLLLATSYDGSITTTAKHTSVRVVCQNTLFASLRNGEPAIKVNHRSIFDEQQVKIDLGILEDEWADFGTWAGRMHEQKITRMSTAARWYAELLSERTDLTDEQVVEFAEDNRVLRQLVEVFRHGKGGEPTIWGLVNGTTAFIDHVRGRSADTRLNAAWFGNGATLKAKAWEKAMATVAANDGQVLVAA